MHLLSGILVVSRFFPSALSILQVFSWDSDSPHQPWAGRKRMLPASVFVHRWLSVLGQPLTPPPAQLSVGELEFSALIWGCNFADEKLLGNHF